MQVIMLVDDDELGEREANVYVLDFDYNRGTPDITCGPPENCEQGEGPTVDVYKWKEVRADGVHVDLPLSGHGKESLELLVLEALEGV